MNCRYRVGTADIQGDRENQEDSYIATDPAGSNRPFHELDQILIAVADGVGGETAGEIASQTTVQTFSQSVQQRYASDTWPVILYNALSSANQTLRQAISENPDYNGMASTLVAAVIDGNKLYWISVGDSHLYLLRGDEIKKLNADHSLGAVVDRQAEAGLISASEAANAQYRNMLMSCIMGEELTEVDLSHEPLALNCGDRLILASDGLNTLDNGQILQISNEHGVAHDCAQALVKTVTRAKQPNQDNTMVVVVDLSDDIHTEPQAPDSQTIPVKLIIGFLIITLTGLLVYFGLVQ